MYTGCRSPDAASSDFALIVDDRLKFDAWCDSIAKNIRLRTSFISRLSKTVKMNRKTLETFYQGYVRGYMNYAIEIWSSARDSIKEKIFRADRQGIRVTCGALNRTSNVELLEEANLCNIDKLINKSILRKTRKYLTHECHEKTMRKLCDITLNEATVLYCMKGFWISCGLPLEKEALEQHEYTLLYRGLMKSFHKEKLMYKYRNNFWEECLLGRCRMNVLPTKAWAHSMRLEYSANCRHCHAEEETIDHLFYRCLALDTEMFLNHVNIAGKIYEWNEIRENLKNPRSPLRGRFEKCIIEYTRNNNLFKIV